MAKVEVKMALDPFKAVRGALRHIKKPPSLGKIIAIDYDEEADVLYVKFKHSKTVDNKPLDNEGLMLASMDERNEVAGLTIMEASRFAAG